MSISGQVRAIRIAAAARAGIWKLQKATQPRVARYQALSMAGPESAAHRTSLQGMAPT